MSQIFITETTLPLILARSRDVDASVRKFFYKKKIEEIDIDFLSMEQKNFVLKNGILDRFLISNPKRCFSQAILFRHDFRILDKQDQQQFDNCMFFLIL